MGDKIIVIDYHKGNLQSVVRGLACAGGRAQVSDDPEVIAQAPALVLPGVGAFEDAMDYLSASGEADAIRAAVAKGAPFLGICLGLQLLFERGSECGSGAAWAPGLGLLAGSATRLASSRLKVPHVGWDQIHLSSHGRACPLFAGVTDGAHVYFTHSYALADDVDPGVVAAQTFYTRGFASAVWSNNVFGVQFHPEKSSSVGTRILSNFVQVARDVRKGRLVLGDAAGFARVNDEGQGGAQ